MTIENYKKGILMPGVRAEVMTEPFGYGFGPIVPEQVLTSEQAHNHAEQLLGLLTKVESNAPGGCIDGRGALRMLNYEEVNAGLNAAGGNAISAFYGLEVSGFFGEDSSIFHDFIDVVVALEEAGHPIGFHTRDQKSRSLLSYILAQRDMFDKKSISDVVMAMEYMTSEQPGTACAGSDEMEQANGKLSRNSQIYLDGHLETTGEVEARIEHTFAMTEAQSYEPVPRDAFEALVDRATLMNNKGRLKNWHSVKALLLADKILLARGVSDGVLSRLQVLQDDGKGLHGHNESNVVFIKAHGVTLASMDIYKATGLKDFIVNGDEVGQQTSDTFGYPAAKIGVLLFQVGTLAQVTNGQQRGIILASVFARPH
jgi:hypothetical protein